MNQTSGFCLQETPHDDPARSAEYRAARRVTLVGDAHTVEPAEHLEARICELAGHLTAATCRFLLP